VNEFEYAGPFFGSDSGPKRGQITGETNLGNRPGTRQTLSKEEIIMGFTGRAIEEPKSPAAHRAWQLLSIFRQAEEGWLLLVDALAAGYSSAWYRQVAVLDDIKAKIQADRDRACFILSILTAGIAGGLLGGIASGAVRRMGDSSFSAAFAKNFLTNAASDGASQFGGSAVSYFQSNGSNPFASPGIEPSTYSATMQKNVRLLFAGFHDHVADIVDDLESGKAPVQDGEQWYQFYRSSPLIQSFPSAKDVGNYDFERDASLCLWIAWGAERDFNYWNEAWRTIDNPPRGLFGMYPVGAPEQNKYDVYRNDIPNWDPIVAEIREIDPTLEMRVKRSANFLYPSLNLIIPTTITKRETHIDLRTLRSLGFHSRIRSAQLMSGSLAVPLMTPENARRQMLNVTDIPKLN
jgi:hypothetical protein